MMICRLIFSLSIFALFILLCGLAEAADFPAFNEVDYVVAQDTSRFAELLSEGKKRVVRIALFGDSQETAPGGGGRVYMPRLNYELSKFFGNSPETLIEGVSSQANAWLMRSALGKGTVVDLGKEQLPDIRCVNTPGEGYTYLLALQPKGEGQLQGTFLEGESAFFRTEGIVKAEVFTKQTAGSGGVRFEAQPHDSSQPNYFQKTTSSGVLDLMAAKGSSIQSAKTNALDFGGKKFMQLKLTCSEKGKSVPIVGARFFNETHAYGVVINDFSKGGYRLGNLLKSHNESGDMYRAFGFDAAILHMGANDIGTVNAVDFKKQTEQVIAMIRGWVGDPNYKIILMGDPDLKTYAAGSPRRAEFDQYPGAQASIAMADKNVLVINSRRIVDEKHNWRLGHKKLDGYLADQVHYHPEGGRVLATAEMAVLLGIIGK